MKGVRIKMMINGVNDMNRNVSVNVTGVDTQDISPARLKAMKRSGQVECETCANREYKDGSDETNVSFKSAAHIDPSAAAAKVMAHEQEHVSNAFKKAATDGGKVLQASVSLKTAICPECGTSYVAGGETTTKISYTNEENPYQKQKKIQDSLRYTGKNLDLAC